MNKIETLINNFSVQNLQSFFRSKISSFKQDDDNFDHLFNDYTFDKYKSITKIGEATIQNDEIVFIATKTNDPLTERSGKKKQYEIAKRILKNENVDAALFVFYDENENFRFSFVRANYLGTKRDFSNYKRYSYFVSPKQTNKTFINQVGGCTFSTLDEIIIAFSVEKLNKDFYQEIAEAFYGLIGGKIKIKNKEVTLERILQLPSVDAKDDKKFQEFAVRLIGRTIFCWFLKNKKYDARKALIPEEWLTSTTVINCKKDNYYHTYLEKLFFLILNKKVADRKPDSLPIGHEDVPFLNGGLFETQDDDFFPKDYNGTHKILHNLIIPNEWFENLFKVLEQYNFTIDENSINDSEVSIDPEMLGTIFENLLAEIDPDTEKSARKSTGSFYTPREIVDYMVEQSLLNYLKNKTGIDNEEQLQSLFKEGAENSFDDKQRKAILQALSDVKILDPACGSGAFPMGALHKIIIILQKLDKGAEWWKAKQIEKIDNALVKKALKEKLDNSTSDYARKIGVIQHSIYGVDIQPIAAEISKLRCFLSLIIDENIDDNAENRGVESLPNLEFKFVTANTLIGLTEENKYGQIHADFGENKEILEELQAIRIDYIQARPNEKEEIKKQFKKAQNKLNRTGNTNNLSKKENQIYFWNPFGNQLCDWFDPKWMFGVEKFDIVIGNPPYGVSVKDDYRKKVLNHLPKVPDFEIYYFFIEAAKKFLKDGGIKTYIIPNTFLFNVFASDFRKKLMDNWSINIIDCTAFKIFESATVYNAITIFKNIKESNIITYKITSNADNFQKLILNPEETISKENLLLNNQNWGLVFKLEQNVIDLIKKIKQHDKLINFYDVTQGFIPYRKSDLIAKYGKEKGEKIINNREWHSSIRVNDEYKEEIWGGSINKYSYSKTDSYIWYGKHLATYVDLKYFNQERLLIREITNPTIIACLIKEEFVNDPQIINVIVRENSLSIKTLWAILNSKLATYYHFNSSPKASKGAFPKILIFDINNFPIPKISNNIEAKMEKLVNDILFHKGQNIDIENLENKIDLMVYKLYELTHAEVLLIDPEFKLSQTEYDNYSIA